jgi:type VII secretion protein EccB
VQTRKDQVQAHMFVAGRLVSAMLRAAPDAAQTPMRRFIAASFVGVLLGVIVTAGFGVFGYIKPGGATAWRQPGALIVEKETGARYVFADGELRPVLNYASAKLILGDSLKVVNTSRNSLKGVAHGLPVGIDSAPDALPDPNRLDGAAWQICSALRPDITGVDRSFVTLDVGAHTGAALPRHTALIVRTADDTAYLAWNNRRLRMPDDAAIQALGYGAARQHQVGVAWINALPAGPDLKAPAVPGRGRPGAAIGGRPRLVGQLFEVRGAANASQFFVLAQDGLAPLTRTGAALLLADRGSAAAYPSGRVEPIPVDAADVAQAPRAGKSLVDPGLPAVPPEALSATGDEAPCLQATVGADSGARVGIALATVIVPPAAAEENPATPPSITGGQADRVQVQPGRGLVIRALPGPGVETGTQYLLVDTGVLYPIPKDEVRGILGYGDVQPVPVPTTLLELIPAGRPLDPEAAKTTSRVAPQAPTTP